MKAHILVIMLLLFIIGGTAGCVDEYGDWQKVIIPKVGSIRLPPEWIVTIRNDYWYFTNKPIDDEYCSYYLIGTSIRYVSGEYVDGKEEDRLLRPIIADGVFSGLEQIELIRYGPGYSNSALFHLDRLLIDNTEAERYIIDLYMIDGRFRLIAWDNLIDEETVIMITKSFKRSDR